MISGLSDGIGQEICVNIVATYHAVILPSGHQRHIRNVLVLPVTAPCR
jgi:hypothetical protein